MIRHMLRQWKWCLLVIGCYCMSTLVLCSMVTSYQNDLVTLEKYYANTDIQCDIQARSYTTEPEIPSTIGTFVRTRDYVDSYYGEMHMRTVLMEQETVCLTFGTNDIASFMEKQGLAVDELRKETLSKQECMVSDLMALLYGLNVGDTIHVAGVVSDNPLVLCSPEIPMTIIGIYHMEDTAVSMIDILCPLDMFFGNNSLIATEDGKASYQYYNALSFHIDPAYNKEYMDTIKTDILNHLDEGWVLRATDQELYQAVLPFERKIQNNRLVIIGVAIVLALVSIVSAIIFASSYQTDILIRRIFAEKKGKILLQCVAEMCIVLAIAVLMTYVFAIWMQVLNGLIVCANAVLVLVSAVCTWVNYLMSHVRSLMAKEMK